MTSAYASRHMELSPCENDAMLETLGYDSLEDFIKHVIPKDLRDPKPLSLPAPLSEQKALKRLKSLLGENQCLKSLLGQGYADTHMPAVIQRNIFENPGWYTAYTPYQAEIAQGRLELLFYFQTMIAELTGLPVANASLLDESSAAVEAMTLAWRQAGEKKTFLVDSHTHPQTIDVLQTRAKALGIHILVTAAQEAIETQSEHFFGVLLQYPTTFGEVADYSQVTKKIHEQGALVIVAADLLALTLLTSPGQWGADICIGNSQRFGVPMGFGGPHAAFMSCCDRLKRKMPGRIIGKSYDSHGNPAYRLALQTREQHIRRDKATSNICTAQVFLAVLATCYAIYHGKEGLVGIAQRIASQTARLAQALREKGYHIVHDSFFDTLLVTCEDSHVLLQKALEKGYNLRLVDARHLAISLDETTTQGDLDALSEVFGLALPFDAFVDNQWPQSCVRVDDFCTSEVFNRYRTETEFMRFISALEKKDLALNTSMIALGSCTMKLNAAASMAPLSWSELNGMHPFVPVNQAAGTLKMLEELSQWLAAITGFYAVSLQPNSGAQGEYAGLLTIMAYHHSRGDKERTVCLIPSSAHGTNPASAVLAGMEVLSVPCDPNGNIDIEALRELAKTHAAHLGALMVTYPSTHGVYEENIQEICAIVHAAGGQVYMDGANMNAQVGIMNPAFLGADVCHLNLHKTFAIPHGGGGPGVGPIGVAEHLFPFLPGHFSLDKKGGAVSAAAFGSASVNVISWMYIAMMGAKGLQLATQKAVLHANYVAKLLERDYPILFKGATGHVAHECIVDMREITKKADCRIDDIAKRLMDYGYHSPTMSFPVAGTLMVEPTESESKEELDRFCEAMAGIANELRSIIEGRMDKEDNPLKNAPHTAPSLLTEVWTHPYSREQAAYPIEGLTETKFWPAVGRIDNVAGDRVLVCTAL